MSQVAVIGAGLIGRSWAIVFACAGWRVVLHDTVPAALDKALGHIRGGLEELESSGLVEDPGAAMTRIAVARDLSHALEGAVLVQENVPETLEAKRSIFAELDRLAAPEAILASSTSAIGASHFAEPLAGRHRCLVAHPVNPPHLVPLVELVGSPWTAPQILERAKSIYELIGQVPIVVRREIDGFVLNRLQGALLAEAFRLVGEGYVSAHDLDKTVKDGLGLRWSFMGPFATIELNAPGGVPDYCARYTVAYRRIQADPATPAVYDNQNIDRIIDQWGATPTPAELTRRTEWRNRRLAALRAHKRSQPDRP